MLTNTMSLIRGDIQPQCGNSSYIITFNCEPNTFYTQMDILFYLFIFITGVIAVPTVPGVVIS